MTKNGHLHWMMERSRSKSDIIGILQKQIAELSRRVEVYRLDDHSTPWIPLTLQNSFTPYGAGQANPAVKRTPAGLVEVKGLVARAVTPAAFTVITTLPVGFRPLEPRIFACDTNSGHGRFDVTPSGAVYYVTGGTVNFGIECHFSAEQ